MRVPLDPQVPYYEGKPQVFKYYIMRMPLARKCYIMGAPLGPQVLYYRSILRSSRTTPLTIVRAITQKKTVSGSRVLVESTVKVSSGSCRSMLLVDKIAYNGLFEFFLNLNKNKPLPFYLKWGSTGSNDISYTSLYLRSVLRGVQGLYECFTQPFLFCIRLLSKVRS